MSTATFVRDLDGFTGTAKLWKVDPPAEYDKPRDEDDPPAKTTEYIVTSATVVFMSGAETYIFPASEDGEILNWGEMEGSYRGGLHHGTAIANAGYEIVDPEVAP